MATGSLDSTTSRSNLQSVWHWVSDSFRCLKGGQKTSTQTEPTQEINSITNGEGRPEEDTSAQRLGSYPHVGHGGGGVKELADDVGGGSNAEEDGANDLLPPGQQQHGVLPPAAPPSCFIRLYQANRSVPLLSVEVAVGEVVAVV